MTSGRNMGAFVARSIAAVLVLAAACGRDAAAPVASHATPIATPNTPATTQSATAPPITAPDGEPFDLLHGTNASLAVSSVYRGDESSVAKLVDGALETAWNSRTDDLVGAWIDVRLPPEATVTSIALTAGFTRRSAERDLFTGNQRVSRVRVTHDGAEVGVYPLDPESRELQTLPVQGSGGTYRIEVASLVPGTRPDWREVCISELRVMGHAAGASAGAFTPRLAVGRAPDLATSSSQAATSAAGATGGPGPAQTSTASPLPRAQAPSTISNDAFFEVEQGRIVRLASDGRFYDALGPGELGFLPAPSPNGRELYAFHFNGIRVVGARDSRSIEQANLRPIVSIAPESDGSMWVALGAINRPPALHRYDGSAWSVIPLGPDITQIRGLFVDRSRVVWLHDGHRVFRRASAALEAVPLPLEANANVWELIGAPDGAVAVVHSNGVLRRVASEWVDEEMARRTLPIEDGRAGGYVDARYTPAGGMVLRSRDAVFVAPARTTYLTKVTLARLSIAASAIKAIDVDRRERIWLATDGGIAVLDSLGRRLAWWPIGSIDALLTGTRGVIVFGDGPPLPSIENRVAGGTVRGRVMRAGQPAAGVDVAMCGHVELRLGSGITWPCDDGSLDYVGRATTDADGRFELTNVPPGAYELAVFRERPSRGPDRWDYAEPAASCCIELRVGATRDLGVVSVRR